MNLQNYLPKDQQGPFSAKATMASHGKSFYFAALFLPKAVAEKAYQLYQLCRHLDDLADGDDPQRLEHLQHIQTALAQNNDSHIALTDDLSVSKVALEDMLAGFVYDQGQVDVKDEAALIHYCYQVAGTVGLMMCDVMQVQEPRALTHAVHLGIALQLTNIARDVGEDAKLGRRYLPRTWLNAETCSQLADLQLPNSAVRHATIQLLQLADHYYRSGLLGIRYLPKHCRLSIYLAAVIYRAIGSDLKQHHYNNLSYRAHLNTGQKIYRSLSVLWSYLLRPPWQDIHALQPTHKLYQPRQGYEC